ncbi:MAG: ImmA/IrrE family metallo-endopeptidase [Clostridia bacterium]|nr:ImmA/IrrE family metallo-endopeptidase [Clostridia bacterium]
MTSRLQRLYQQAEAMGLQVYFLPMQTRCGISTPDGTIGMDSNRQKSTAEELVCLAHEMGHCMTGSFYTAEADLLQRRRCEARADRWAYRQLVPLDELRRLLARGVTRTDELAEHFGVTEDFLRDCLAYYRNAKNAI